MRFNRALQGKIGSDVDALRLSADDAGVIVDVGAGYGGQILKYLKVASPESIYAFEPLARNIEILKENVSAAINFFPYACGATNATVNFFVPNQTPIEGRRDRDGVRADYNGGSRVQDPRQTSGAAPPNTSVERIEQVRLDSILPPGGIRLVKIDVQGHEEHVLRGLGDRLDDVHVAYVEYSPSRVGAATFLQANGFEIYDSKYIIFAPQGSEAALEELGFSDVFGFVNSAGRHRYDCSLTDKIADEDVFKMTLPHGFRVSETDLICVNKRFDPPLP